MVTILLLILLAASLTTADSMFIEDREASGLIDQLLVNFGGGFAAEVRDQAKKTSGKKSERKLYTGTRYAGKRSSPLANTSPRISGNVGHADINKEKTDLLGEESYSLYFFGCLYNFKGVKCYRVAPKFVEYQAPSRSGYDSMF